VNRNHFCIAFLLALSIHGAVTSAMGDPLPTLIRGASYYESKTWHQQQLASNPTIAGQLKAYRSIVEASPYGKRGLESLFGNFEGSKSIDPRIPGVNESVRMLNSSNRMQRKGYARELLHAISIYNDTRLKLVAMNEKLSRPWGNTDADLQFRNGQHGLYGRIEIKDVSLESQSRNLARIKTQIDKMAKEYRYTGQPQFWVNRYGVLPEIKAYAKGRGIPVYEKIYSGKSGPKNGMPQTEFNNALVRHASDLQRIRTIQGATQLGFGLWLLSDSAPTAWSDLQTLLDTGLESGTAWRQFGEHSAMSAAGGAMTISGAAYLASPYANQNLQGGLYRFGRVGGYATGLALVAGEAAMIQRYRAGDVSSREFWTSQWILAGSVGGGHTGTVIGRAVGAAVGAAVTEGAGTGIGATVGAAVGGVVGAKSGGEVTKATADYYYDLKFSALDRRFAEFVYAQYGVD